MRVCQLTSELLNNLKANQIIYAEFSETTAKGTPGVATFYIVHDDTVKCYRVDTYLSSDTNNLRTYALALDILKQLEENGKLIYSSGQLGNHSWKGTKATLKRDDDNISFLFTKDGHTYALPASCPGVYHSVAKDFTKRKAEINDLKEYYDANWQDFNYNDRAFFAAYMNKLEDNNNGLVYFDFTPNDYWQSIRVVKFLTDCDFNYPPDVIWDGLLSLSKYRLVVAVQELGYNELDSIFADLIKNHKTQLFETIDLKLKNKIKITDLFVPLRVIKSSHDNIISGSENCIDEDYYYPATVEYTPNANSKILFSIGQMSPDELRKNAKNISYYLINYLYNEDKLPLADILPVATYIIEKLPDAAADSENADSLFWFACEIIDRAWRYLEEDEKIQKKYRDFVYELFWPRLGSVWPLEHHHLISYDNRTFKCIVSNSANMLLGLDDLAERNDDIRKIYENALGQGQHPFPGVYNNAFYNTINTLTAKEQFEKIVNSIKEDEQVRFFSHPSTTEEAKLLLDELLNNNIDARITGTTRLNVIEQLLLTPNHINIGEYILNYLNEHFNDLTTVIKSDAESENLDYLEIMTSFYTAIAVGITEENEFPPYKQLVTKFRKAGVKEVMLSHAMEFARKHRRAILFQRSSLQQFFNQHKKSNQ